MVKKAISRPKTKMSEIWVENKVRKYLKTHGFDVKKRLTSHGVDITAYKNGKLYLIEAEGNKTRNNEDTQQVYSYYTRAFGQLAIRTTKYPNAKCIMALPLRKAYQKKVEETKRALKLLHFSIYFVNKKGKIVDRKGKIIEIK